MCKLRYLPQQMADYTWLYMEQQSQYLLLFLLQIDAHLEIIV